MPSAARFVPLLVPSSFFYFFLHHFIPLSLSLSLLLRLPLWLNSVGGFWSHFLLNYFYSLLSTSAAIDCHCHCLSFSPVCLLCRLFAKSVGVLAQLAFGGFLPILSASFFFCPLNQCALFFYYDHNKRHQPLSSLSFLSLSFFYNTCTN